jgi:hypothetical protein
MAQQYDPLSPATTQKEKKIDIYKKGAIFLKNNCQKEVCKLNCMHPSTTLLYDRSTGQVEDEESPSDEEETSETDCN